MYFIISTFSSDVLKDDCFSNKTKNNKHEKYNGLVTTVSNGENLIKCTMTILLRKTNLKAVHKFIWQRNKSKNTIFCQINGKQIKWMQICWFHLPCFANICLTVT